jgi:membrane-bound lytic murein transglycosylase B
MSKLRFVIPCYFLLPFLLLSTPTHAAQCGGDFNTFVAAISREAAGKGISQSVISQSLSGVTPDPAVLSFDRRQRYTFNKTFEQYVSTRVGAGRINGGRAMLQRHAALLARIEARFGVPPEIVVAIWGLESDFGKGDIGKMPVIRTLAAAPSCSRAS